MIPAKIKVALNKRGAPSVNASRDRHYTPGEDINIVDIVNGDPVDGIDVWYKLDNGSYVWSGGVKGVEDIVTETQGKPPEVPVDRESFLWPIKNYDIDHIWQITKGQGINVGILDTGIQKSHPDLEHAIEAGYNFVGKNTDYDDWDGHGTHCAGIIAAKGLRDVFGVSPEVKLYVGKIMNSINSGIRENVLLDALDWMAGKVDIISISAGKPDDLPSIEEKIIELTEIHDIIVVSAIGNDGANSTGDFPARYSNCISVGAFDEGGKLWPGTSRFDKLTVCSPGSAIKSTWRESSYEGKSGTSMAAPYISGILALLKSIKPGLSFSRAKQVLMETSEEKKEGPFTFRNVSPQKIFKI